MSIFLAKEVECPSQQTPGGHRMGAVGGGVGDSRLDKSVYSPCIPPLMNTSRRKNAASNMSSAWCRISVCCQNIQPTQYYRHYRKLLGSSQRVGIFGLGPRWLRAVLRCRFVSVKLRSQFADGCRQPCTERIRSLGLDKLGHGGYLYILRRVREYL